MAYCTILSTNYLAKALTLADTLQRHHPGARLTVLVIDSADAAHLVGDRAAGRRDRRHRRPRPAAPRGAQARHHLRPRRGGHRRQAAAAQGPPRGRRAGGVPRPGHLRHQPDGRAVARPRGDRRRDPAHAALPRPGAGGRGAHRGPSAHRRRLQPRLLRGGPARAALPRLVVGAPQGRVPVGPAVRAVRRPEVVRHRVGDLPGRRVAAPGLQRQRGQPARAADRPRRRRLRHRRH